MVRTTERVLNRRLRPLKVSAAAGLVLLAAMLLALTGCSSPKAANASGAQSASGEATAGTSYHMSGAPATVYVSQQVVDSRRPQKWDLSTPESAVRSYLAWVAYAYRIGDSQVATPTMGPDEEVRMDSYCQFNLEKKRLLDENLNSITFGTPSKTSTVTLVPAKESWTYSYLSVDKGNAVIGGPYDIKYDSTYRVHKDGQGNWIVESVDAKSLGTVK